MPEPVQRSSAARNGRRTVQRPRWRLPADPHDLIGRNNGIPGMRKRRPGVIGTYQAIPHRKQRRTSPGYAHFIDGEEPGADKYIAFGSNEQLVEFFRRKSPLQKKQIDRQSERIAAGQTLSTTYRRGLPLEVGKILQPRRSLTKALRISETSDFRNGAARPGTSAGATKKLARSVMG